VLASPLVVPLVGDVREEGEVFRRRDGRMLPVDRETQTFSTVELLGVEQRFVDRVVEGAGAPAAVEPAALERALAERPTLSEEQRAMVERLCLGGDRVVAVVGRAGTGKTFALGVARAAWQDGGHAVLGVAVARRAADELKHGAGIASTSVAALLGDLDRHREKLPPRCVLVVDEAGMVPTRQLAALLDHVEAADGKLVLVGDHHQLPALEAGGAFRGLVQRGLAVELTENRRQVEAWERGALELLRDGRAADALAAYQAHGRFRIEVTGDDARERLVADWWCAGDPDATVMIARRCDDVADLNARARRRLADAGGLGERAARLPGGEFAVGDRVVVKLNDLRLGVTNGERGRVVGVSRRAVDVELRGRVVRLDAEFLTGRTAQGDPTLVHGYAITGHVAQGLTMDRAYVLGDEGMSREWGYTAMSRGRLANHLYAPAEPDDARVEYAPGDPAPDDPVGRLARALTRSDDTSLAIDAHRLTYADERPVARRWWQRRRSAASDAAREQRILDERRKQMEEQHAGRRFVTQRELDDEVVRMRGRAVERRLERGFERDAVRELGR
jgi:ATP-dependent exoDNAse (exonuclease V) alpha subunit